MHGVILCFSLVVEDNNAIRIGEHSEQSSSTYIEEMRPNKQNGLVSCAHDGSFRSLIIKSHLTRSTEGDDAEIYCSIKDKMQDE